MSDLTPKEALTQIIQILNAVQATGYNRGLQHGQDFYGNSVYIEEYNLYSKIPEGLLKEVTAKVKEEVMRSRT